MSRTPLPIDAHPFYDSKSRLVRSFRGWQKRWRNRGVEPGCIGIYLYTVAIRQNDPHAQFRSVARKGPESVRKRPSWCSARLWHNWSTYCWKFGVGIPLAAYMDPKRRKHWMDNRATRPLTPREAAQALLKRKGLAP